MGSNSSVTNGTPKGTPCTGNASFEPSFTFVRSSVRAVKRESKNAEKQKQNKTKQKQADKNVTFRVGVWGAPGQQIVIIFGAARDLADVIMIVTVCIDQFKGFGLKKGQSCGWLVGNRIGPYYFCDI